MLCLTVNYVSKDVNIQNILVNNKEKGKLLSFNKLFETEVELKDQGQHVVFIYIGGRLLPSTVLVVPFSFFFFKIRT